jgi:hypothetical protein
MKIKDFIAGFIKAIKCSYKYFHLFGAKNFEMWCWRSMGMNCCTDHVKNEEVLHRDKEERNIVHTIQKEGQLNC